MLKKFGCAVAVLLIGSIALADTVRGLITKIGDDEITVSVFKKKGEEPEKKTYKISKKTKVLKMKGKDDNEDSSLKALTEAVEKSSKGKGKFKGTFALIEVDDGKVTEIKYFAGFGKKKKKKADD